ncbi:transposase [Fructobacillus ficulneus]|uniref:Transposase n=1 Tax=Fructobacillus ficulneus TaxID=157463 RepID=A0A0K8MGG6_9LACO|nr:transposase [Fructobacillus ficulneus]
MGSGYCFIWIDSDMHQIGEILPSRRQNQVTDYFMRFPKEQRLKAQTVTVDPNASYISFIQKIFPNAATILDRFHVVNMANRSLNMIRKRLMNQFNHSSRQYRVLKSNWRLFLKDCFQLETSKSWLQKGLGYVDTQQNLVHYGLTLDPEFAAAYETYQGLLLALRNRDQKLLKQTLNQYEALGNEMEYNRQDPEKALVTTFKVL